MERPRNVPAEGEHGLFAREGMNLSELIARGREEVEGYGGESLAGEVLDARAAGDGSEASLFDGTVLPTRTLLIAIGGEDELPAIHGLREQRRNGVHHCPYCNGWEVRDQRPGDRPDVGHQAVRFRQWSPASPISPAAYRLRAMESDGGRVVGVRVDDDNAEGGVTNLDAVVVSTRLDVRTDSFGAVVATR